VCRSVDQTRGDLHGGIRRKSSALAVQAGIDIGGSADAGRAARCAPGSMPRPPSQDRPGAPPTTSSGPAVPESCFPPSPFPPMSPFRGPRPVRETAGGQSALTSGPAPAHRRPTRQRPRRCPSTETPADSTGPAAGDHHRRALSCRSCEEHVPARHTGWSHYWQPGGPMTVAKLDSNGHKNVASDNAPPRMRNHLQCHKSRSRQWRQHQQG
jgi:hypothetical protein